MASEMEVARQDAPNSTPTPAGGGTVQRQSSMRGVDYTTAVQRLAPVQQKEDTANVHAAAQRGTSGGGGSLPYLAQIQKSFGQHDVSGIKSHTGGKASEACESMGAEAYASGQDVAFKGQPDLHTAAHEAAHIVQQKAGVQLSGGVGKAGDPYEKNADEVADRVVQGKSAEDLLGGPSFGGAAAVQRSVQMKGGLLDKLKAFFLEAKLTGPQQQVAKILAEKHGVDVSGLPTATFASLYNDAGGNNPKQSPDKTAANMASAARDHVGEKKPTQKKESGIVSGVAVQRKEARNVERSPVQRDAQKPKTEKSVGLDTSKITQGTIGANFAAGRPIEIKKLPEIRTPLPWPPGAFTALGLSASVQVQGGGTLSIKEGAKVEFQGSANCKGYLQVGLGVPDANVNVEGAIDVAVGSVSVSVSKNKGKYSGTFALSAVKVEAQLSLNAKAGPLGASWALAKAPLGEFAVVGYDSNTGKWSPVGWTWSEEAKDFFERLKRLRGQGYSKTALEKEIDLAMKESSPDYKSLLLSISRNNVSATSYVSQMMRDKRHAKAMKALILSPQENAFRASMQQTPKGREVTQLIWRG